MPVVCINSVLSIMTHLARLTICKDIFDLTAHVSNDPDPEYVEELRNKMHITEQLVTAFVQLGRKKELPLLKDETYRRCQAAETEVRALIV